MSDPLFERGFDHPCKQTCSGWQQGYERGRDDLQKQNDELVELVIEFAKAIEPLRGSYIAETPFDIRFSPLISMAKKVVSDE